MHGVMIDRPLPGVVHFAFPTDYLMASTFLRFQEHYESPRFAGKVFSLEEFMDWYADEHDGKFTYYDDWGGFNIPSRVFAPFRKGVFDPLSRKETWLLEQVHGEVEPFYAIGTTLGGSPLSLKHELAHARFSLDPAYQQAVREVLDRIPARTRARCERTLREEGYRDEVFDDEIHAYLLTDPQYLRSVSRQIPESARELERIFRS